jgi:phosphoglycerate dehydrogenase-like enzyme
MESSERRITVASNLGFGLDERLKGLPFVGEVLSLPATGSWTLPASAEFLIYLHRPGEGGRGAPRPQGWPGQLRAIQCAAAGLDQYPDWLFEVSPVACARGTNSAAIAEYAMTAMLTFEKRIPQIWQDGEEPWPTQAETASRPLGGLEGKTVGLIGWGSIAQRVASLAAPFGMRVMACRRNPGPASGDVQMATFAEVVAGADHLVLALPLTNDSAHILDAKAIGSMKKSAHLINVSRGGLVDQAALESALIAGTLAGATLDVTDPEPLPRGASLYRAPNIRISAHVSWASPLTMLNVSQKIAANLKRFALGAPLLDVVDPTLRY